MILEGTYQLNHFPSQYGLSGYYSLNMITSKKSLDYKKYCQYAIGSAIQAHHEPKQKNLLIARKLDCFYL